MNDKLKVDITYTSFTTRTRHDSSIITYDSSLKENIRFFFSSAVFVLFLFHSIAFHWIRLFKLGAANPPPFCLILLYFTDFA